MLKAFDVTRFALSRLNTVWCPTRYLQGDIISVEETIYQRSYKYLILLAFLLYKKINSSMISFFFIFTFIFTHISFILIYSISHSDVTSIKSRTNNCNLFNINPNCLFSGNNSFSVATANFESDLFLDKAEITSNLLPDTITYDEIDSSGSSKQISLMTDLSMSALNTDCFEIETIDPNLSQNLINDIKFSNERDNFFDKFSESSIIDQPKAIFEVVL